MFAVSCPVTDTSATVAPIGVKFCMMVHNVPDVSSLLLAHIEGSGHKGSKAVLENFRENEVKDLQH